MKKNFMSKLTFVILFAFAMVLMNVGMERVGARSCTKTKSCSCSYYPEPQSQVPETGSADASSQSECESACKRNYNSYATGTYTKCGSGDTDHGTWCSYTPTSSSCTSGYSINCDNGEYKSSTTTCSVCTAGYYCISNSRIACAKGYYSSGSGNTSCTACAKGTYASSTGSTSCTSCGSGKTTASTGSTSSSQCIAATTTCNSYQYLDNGTCTNCPAGYSCNGTTKTVCTAGTYASSSSTSCTPCAAGSYASNSGSSSCTACPAGKYASGTGNTKCTACEKGTYASSTSSPSCTSCGSGKTTASTGATSSSQCIAETTSCSSTQYLDNGTCKNCLTNCATCTNGTACTSCKTGYIGSDCSSCLSGYYKSGTSCAACPTNCSGCTSASNCTSCKAGYSGTTCSDCRTGYYKSGTSCVACPTNCTACSSASNCTSCKSGYSGKTCTDTDKPKAVITCSNKEYTGAEQTIATCSGGTISGNNGRAADIGNYTYTCKGDSSHSDATPVTCSITASSSSTYKCYACGGSQGVTYRWASSNPSTASCSVVNKSEKDCSGSTSTPGSCGAGDYLEGSTCIGCPKGYTSTAGSVGQDRCYRTCEAGTYMQFATSSTCSNCPEGTTSTSHNVYYGATSTCSNASTKPQAVIQCSNKTYNGEEQVIASCSGGTISSYSPYGPGKGKAIGNYTFTCKGDSSHSDANATVCKITEKSDTSVDFCDNGQYLHSGVCYACPKGYTSNGATAKEETDCYITCAANTYMQIATSSTCTACSSGKTSTQHKVYYRNISTCTDGTTSKPKATITCSNKSYTGSVQTIATCSGGTISDNGDGAGKGKAVGYYTFTCKGDDSHSDADSKVCQITYGTTYTCYACGGSQGVTYRWASSNPSSSSCVAVAKTESECTGTSAATYMCYLCSGTYYWATSAPSTSGCSVVAKSKTECQGGTSSTDIKVTGITLDKDSASVVKGKTVTFVATITPSNATNKSVTWSSSDTSIATVSGGVVTGIKVGKVTITATAADGSGKSASATVNVTNGGGSSPQKISVTGITVSPTKAEVEVGKTVTLTATISPADATNKNVTWKSSDTTIATVSNGVVTGVKEGTATITVTSEDGNKSATSTITVKPATSEEVPVTGLKLNPTSGKVEVGGTFVLEAVITPENASNKNVTWKSSDATIASVNGGVVTGVKVGTVTITATTEDGNKTATASIEVVEAGSSGTLSFDASSYTCEVGSVILTYVKSSLGIKPTVSSSDASIASVSFVSNTEYTEKCVANSVQTKCITITDKEYPISISCAKAGSVTLTAAATDSISATAKVTVKASGQTTSITFDGNGGKLKYNNVDNDMLTIDGVGTTTISEALSGVTLVRNGYDFLGWYTAKENGVGYSNNSKFGEIGVSILYAHWQLKVGTKFTLTYNSNGGTACSPATIQAAANTAWGTLCTPTKKGYTFNGWYTASVGGKKITSDSLATEDLTVYAQWKKGIDNPKTGISTPIAALLVLGLISSVAFFAVKRKRAEL